MKCSVSIMWLIIVRICVKPNAIIQKAYKLILKFLIQCMRVWFASIFMIGIIINAYHRVNIKTLLLLVELRIRCVRLRKIRTTVRSSPRFKVTPILASFLVTNI